MKCNNIARYGFLILKRMREGRSEKREEGKGEDREREELKFIRS
jgi:hypothetical protein